MAISSRVNSSEASSFSAGGGRLLVVDDDPLVRTGLARVLGHAGHQVTLASGGAEALLLASETLFDAVLADLTMPEMGGMQLLAQLRALDPDLPLLVLTGAPDLKSAVRAVELGAFRYLMKPIADDELCAAVAAALQAHQTARRGRHALKLVAHAPGARDDGLATQATLDDVLGSMWMAYQPIVGAGDHRLFAHEALLRARSPHFTSPDALLLSAERLCRLNDVGRSVRALVADQLRRDPHTPLVFVNLYATDLLDEELYDPAAPLTEFAARVVLELTERASLEGIADVPHRMERLRALGFRMAVDDLGAGYAGLTSLALIRPEFVKVDMSLVRDVQRDEMRQRLIQSLISACHGSGTQVVAEGVENADERDVLQELGCDLLQGYLFGRPAAQLASPV